MSKLTSTMQNYWAAIELRQYAQKYLRSNKVHDVTVGETLEAIANDLTSNNNESAKLRFDALHPNVKSGVSFKVLEVLDKAEIHGK